MMTRSKTITALLLVLLMGAPLTLAQESTPVDDGAAGTATKRKMPWEVKDELTYFEPALTPWPPLPPGMSFDDLMDEFLASKNLSQEGRDGPVPTPDWDRQYLIMRELFKLGRAGAVPKLLEVITRRDEQWLRIAVELSAYFEDPRIIPEVTEVAADPSLPKETRITAVVTLGRVGDASIVPTLIRLFDKEKDPLVRAVIIEQMDFVGSDAAVSFLCKKWKGDPDVNVRVSAVYGLVNFDTDAAVDCIIAATKSKDAQVREVATKVLSRTAGAAAAAAMKDRPGLYTPRRLAMMARAREAVGPRLADADPKVRIAAARALYDLGDASSLPYIDRAMQSEDVELKEVLVELLARVRNKVNEEQPEGEFLPIPTEMVVPILERALATEPERIAYLAARSLGYSKSGKAVDALEKALENPSQVVRNNAALALGNIGTDRAVLALIAAAPKADQRVQYSIAQALSQTKKPSAVAALMRMSKQGEPNFRANALSLLGEAGDPDAIPVLRVAMQDTNPVIRASAIRGLGYLKDRSAIPDLVNMMDDPMAQIRGAAVNALVEFKDPALTEVVARRLSDPEEAVRSVTLDALERNGDPMAIKYIAERYKQVRDDLDFASLVGMGNIQGAAKEAGHAVEPDSPADAVPVFLDQIFTNNWQKRLACMNGLGRAGDARAIPVLRELLKDPVVDVRVSALDTIGILGSEGGVEIDQITIDAIKELRARGDDRWVRDISVVNLLRLGDQETIDWVVDQAKNDENPELRQYAIMYMQESKNPQLVPYLVEMLDDEAEIGLAITSIGLVPGGPPYYEASSGLYPKVQEYVVGAIRYLTGNGHPAIDLAPTPDKIGYGIFETRVERKRKVQELKEWWANNKDEFLRSPKPVITVPVPLGASSPSAAKEPPSPSQP